MNYDLLRQRTNFGWNTWNTRNVLSYSHLPEGFTINLCIKDFRGTDTLRESLVGRHGENEEVIFPGQRSYDGSSTRLTLKYLDLSIDVRTVVAEDEQYILLTPLKTGRKTPALIIEACLLWGKDGSVGKQGNRLFGDCGGQHFEIYTNGTPMPLQHTASLGPYIAVPLDNPIVISTRPCTIEDAENLYQAASEKLDEENRRFGVHWESNTAMKTCLAWDTIYEPEHNRVCSPVSRIWNNNWGGYVLFDWDTYFAALMASVENKELAQLNAIAITDEVTERGFIPNFGAANGLKSRDRSQPPVGSFVCMEIYKKWPEKWFLQRVYPTLLGWNRWFADNRMTGEGYLCWGSDPYEPVNDMWVECNNVHDWQGAAFESGLDNSPMYDGMAFNENTHLMLLADVGLMGLYIMDCRNLAQMARIVGDEAAIGELEARKYQVEQAMDTLWDEEFGLYLNRNLSDGTLSRRISPTNFYALHSDRISEDRKKRMMAEHFYNPEEFWGEYILPTIARNDPGYPDNDYWRGRIWAPTNFLCYAAMKHAGLKAECGDLARKSEELILKEWRLHGHVHENYDCGTGMGCGLKNSDKFYHWGGLLSYIALDHEENQ